MVIQVAQMSDLHFCQKNLEESNRTFGFAVDDAIRNKVRAAVITGDSTDHALEVHDSSLHALAGHLKRLADHCPVLMLQGTFSHEPPGVLRVLKMIGARNPIAIADRISMFGLTKDGFEHFQPETKYELAVTAFPTVNKAELVASAGAGCVAAEMGDILFGLMQQFAPVNKQLREQGVPTMLIGHGTVQNCETEHGVPMAGTDHEFGAGALFAAQCDAVALGHIHKHQVWNRDKQIIAYAGSIGRFHHGEDGAKHYLNWRMEAGNPSFMAVDTPSRRTVDLFFDGVPDMKVIADAVQHCAGAYVRIRYSVDEESKQLVNRDAIKAILADACDLQIEGKTLVIERQRAAGISMTISIVDKLKTWCEITQSDAGPLVDRLSDLQTKEAADIAAQIMKEIKDGKSENIGKTQSALAGGSGTADRVRELAVSDNGARVQQTSLEPDPCASGRIEQNAASEHGVDQPERVRNQDSLFA